MDTEGSVKITFFHSGSNHGSLKIKVRTSTIKKICWCFVTQGITQTNYIIKQQTLLILNRIFKAIEVRRMNK
jgi:hypothetical protein